jgi:hypothetical protein
MAFRPLVGLGLATVLLGSGCRRPQGETGQTSSVPAPMIDDGPPPEILAIMTCATGPVRVLKDGRQTRGLKEAPSSGGTAAWSYATASSPAW